MISVILPCYHCGPWLRQAVDSVLSQTYTDWEILLIDDGSQDDTPSLARALAASDPRIRYMETHRMGLAEVRNHGIREARGEYIAFLDGDDILLPESLSILFSMISDNDADIAGGRFIPFNDGDELKAMARAEKAFLRFRRDDLRVMTGREAAVESMYQTGVQSSVCVNIFKRSLFEGLTFTPGELYEDLNLFYRLALKSDIVAVTSLPVYLYRQRKGSIIHSFDRRRTIVLEVTRRMTDLASESEPTLRGGARSRRFAANYNMLLLMKRELKRSDLPGADREYYQNKIKETREYLRANALPELRDPRARLKNRLGALLYLLIGRF